MPTRPVIRRRSAIPELYRRLDPETSTIRLFEFHEDSDANIVGSLSTYDISDAQCPAWIALSYTWDLFELSRHSPVSHRHSQDPLRTIIIDGYKVAIRANLLHALRAILAQRAQSHKAEQEAGEHSERREVQSSEEGKYFSFTGPHPPVAWRFFWIDAISINQNDQEERHHQIRLMNRIFSQATSVISWLTPFPEDLGPEARASILQLLQTDKNASDAITRSPRAPTTPTRTHINVHGQAIIHNAYWQRMWIVPEVVLARNINFLYGSIWLSEKFMHEALQNHTAPAGQILRHRKVFQEAGCKRGAIGFQELIDSYSFKQCSDVRDRIFALLCLLPADVPLEADYKFSTTQIFLLLLEYQGAGATSLHMKSWSLALNLDWRDPIIESHLWLHSRRASRRKNNAVANSSAPRDLQKQPTLLDVVQPLILFIFYRIFMPVSTESFEVVLRLLDLTQDISSALSPRKAPRLIFNTLTVLVTFILGHLWTLLSELFTPKRRVKQKSS